MIRGSWDMLHLFCGNHGELKELTAEKNSKGICYICPENQGTKPCNTQISVEEYEEILGYISNKIVKAEMEGEVADLTHTIWKTKKGICCRVLLHHRDRIHIMVDCEMRRK